MYFPSFSAGSIAAAMEKNWRMPGGLGFRYYESDFPKKYQLKAYLTTAGHCYKKMKYCEPFEFPDDMHIFGDSGGFQIAMGRLEYSDELRDKILKWLEANSTLAANLDIPPKASNISKFQESLDISRNNFEYFYEKQSGKTLFLNVLQGLTYERYKHWYDSVKDLEFGGWAIGVDQRTASLYQILASLVVMLEGKEHFKKNNKWFHYLGVTGTSEMIYLEQIQKSLNEVGSNVQVSTDSSSPNIQSKFGGYWIPKGLGYSNIHVPRGKDNKVNYKDKKGWLPITNDLDRLIAENYEYDMTLFDNFKSEGYALLALHNYGVFMDSMAMIREAVYADDYFKKEILDRRTYELLLIIDQIIKSDNPTIVFHKHLNRINTFNEVRTQDNSTAQEFFTF